MTTEPRGSHPLVTIAFHFEDWRSDLPARDIRPGIELDPPMTLERHWYHVPRVGDHITLSEPEMLNPLTGTVKAVEWKDSGRDAEVWFS